MMKIQCEVIQDLLPLYCDSMASSESVRLIEEHLQECEACRSLLELMKDHESVSEHVEEANRKELDPLKKIRKANRKKVAAGIIVAIVVMLGVFGIFFKYCVQGEIASSADVRVTTSGSTEYEMIDGEKVKCYLVDINLDLQNGKCINLRSDRNLGTGGEHVLTVYQQVKFPFDDRGKYPGHYSCGQSKESPFTDLDRITIQYADKSVEYNLREIAEAAGIQ